MSALQPRLCVHYSTSLEPCPHCAMMDAWAAADIASKTYQSYTLFQNFWKCEHHPSALANYFVGIKSCRWGCHLAELHSTDSGFHKTGK